MKFSQSAPIRPEDGAEQSFHVIDNTDFSIFSICPAGFVFKLRLRWRTSTLVPMTPKNHPVAEVVQPQASLERRRYQRIHLQIPLFIRGKDAHKEQFMELAKTLDISALGAFIACPRPLAIHDVVTLTIPSPAISSSSLLPAGMPPIQARVRRQEHAGDVYLVGVEFLKPLT